MNTKKTTGGGRFFFKTLSEILLCNGGKGGDQLQAAGQAAAVEDGEAVGQDWMVDVQVVVVDKVQYQGDVGGVLTSFLSFSTGFQLQLRYQFLIGGN